jgi:hypothetical protein
MEESSKSVLTIEKSETSEKNYEYASMLKVEFDEYDSGGLICHITGGNLKCNHAIMEQNFKFTEDFFIEITDEKQMLELYFFLKANLAKKYGSIL